MGASRRSRRGSVREASEDGPLKRSRGSMSETRKYRKFTAQQKTEIVLASLRGPKSMAELCREHEIADSLLSVSGASSSSRPAPSVCRARRSGPRPTSCAARSPAWSGRWAARRWRSRSRGNSCGAGSETARRPVPRAGRARPPRRLGRARGRDQPPGDLPAPASARRPVSAAPLDATDRVVLDVARANPTDGTRMVAALASRELAGAAVNRKRVQRLMREHRLLQPKRSEGRRRRPGYLPGHAPGRALASRHDRRSGSPSTVGVI